MKDNAYSRSFIRSRIILTLWYIAFCLAIIALLNFGAFAAQTASLQTPTKSIGFGSSGGVPPNNSVAILNDNNTSIVTTLDTINKRFGQTLIVGDSVLIVLAIPFSYLLGGLTLRPIRKVMQQQEEFAQEVSHELRTPLSVIAIEVETLKRSDNSPNPSAVTHIGEELERMNRLVDGLLMLVHPHQKTRLIKRAQPFDLTRSAQAVFLQLQKIADSKQVTASFVSEYTGNVIANQHDIEQAISILLENAIKYSPTGKEISLRIVQLSKQEVSVIVQDNGPGIDKEDLPHIFDRFYRGKNTGTYGEGTGLGLALAKRIVTLHKGRVTIESQVGEGTTARIILRTDQNE